jgi:multiple sugar transport system substrate-binding protein
MARQIKGGARAPNSGLRRRDFLLSSAAVAGAAVAGTFGLPKRVYAASKAEITFASAKFFAKDSMNEVIEKYNSAQNAVHVTYTELPPPSSSTEVHQQLVQMLAAASGTPDVFTQDIVWIAEFAEAGWAAPLDEYFKADDMKAYFPGIVQGCTWNGKLTAHPWFVDSGMLFYRKDILEKIGAGVPETWDQLIEAATKGIGGDTKFGLLWQGKQAEVLVCDLVSFVGSNGGSILAPDGKTVKIADADAKAAVQLMYDTIAKHKITPADVLSWDEEPSRRPFVGGQSVFLRNWSYTWATAQDKAESQVVDKVGVAPLPHFPGKSSAACLGGYQYGINASSKEKAAAVDFLQYLVKPETQLHFAVSQGLAPTRQDVFDSAELGKANPFMQSLKSVFVGALPRPVTPKYPQVSLVLQSQVSKALSSGDIDGSLAGAKDQIDQIIAA